MWCFDFTGEDQFHLDFVRQFTVYEEDEYSRWNNSTVNFYLNQRMN